MRALIRVPVIRGIDKIAAKHPRIVLCVAIVIAVACLSIKNDMDAPGMASPVQNKRVIAPGTTSVRVIAGTRRTTS